MGYCPAEGTDDPMEPCHGEETKRKAKPAAQGQGESQTESENGFEGEASGSEKLAVTKKKNSNRCSHPR